MANDKYFNGPLDMDRDWGGNKKENILPSSGKAVQDFLKSQLNSKVGYLGIVDKASRNYYVLARDQKCFDAFYATVDEEHPNGDPNVKEGIIGTFDAPFQYRMEIELVEPKTGTKSILSGAKGNKIVYRTVTRNVSSDLVPEDIEVSYRIKNGGGVETTVYQTRSYSETDAGIEFNIDEYLTDGENVITIMATGKGTSASAMARVVFKVLDISIEDTFKINEIYKYSDQNNSLNIPIPYKAKGIGKTRIYWYVDGQLYDGKPEEMPNNYNNQTAKKTLNYDMNGFHLENGIHTLQFYLECDDSNNEKNKFQTPVYYREFIVENDNCHLEAHDGTRGKLMTPQFVRSLSYNLSDHNMKIFGKGETPIVYDAIEFSNAELDYYIYYAGKNSCLMEVTGQFEGDEQITNEKVNVGLVESKVKTFYYQVNKNGKLSLKITPLLGDEKTPEDIQPIETIFEVKDSGMDINTKEDGVILYLNAFGKTNDSVNPEDWSYTLPNGKVITTTFSKNGYVKVRFPKDIKEGNVYESDTDPQLLPKKEGYKYLRYKGEYYVWEREFEWSENSGWNDNHLSIADGNSLTINYRPLSALDHNIDDIIANGGTFEFAFRTVNVRNDNAVICQVIDNEEGTPSITIRASEAELMLRKGEMKQEEDGTWKKQYDIKVSTRFRAGDLNRISFVITPKKNISNKRQRMFKVYVNGVLCGAEAYDENDSFRIEDKIVFRGSDEAEIELYSLKFYNSALNNYDILNNYIYYQNSTSEKLRLYERNNILMPGNLTEFDIDVLKERMPVMVFKQLKYEEPIEALHNERDNKKKICHMDVEYFHNKDKSLNFVLKNANITPQGTSSMAYPVKNFRIYSSKNQNEDPKFLYVGSNIWIKDPKGGDELILNPDALVDSSKAVEKRKNKYSFKNATETTKKAAPVKCWCLKADFAESSSSHNTGTARYWNDVLVNAGLTTKSQKKANDIKYKYDVRTCIDGFPIVLFYQSLREPNIYQFVGKYNFNNDKSSEDVFGFTGGDEVENGKYRYYPIGNESPIVQLEDDGTPKAKWEKGGYDKWNSVLNKGLVDPDDYPVYVSKTMGPDNEMWYMLKTPESFSNPYMQCWEFRNSTSDLALFKSMEGLTTGTKKNEDKEFGETIGLVGENGEYEEAFESRFPDGGDYYNPSELKRFMKWMVSTRYLNVVPDPKDPNKGICEPFSDLKGFPDYHANNTLHIESLTHKTGEFEFDYKWKNFYEVVEVSPDDLEDAHYALREKMSEEDIIETKKDGKVISIADDGKVPTRIVDGLNSEGGDIFIKFNKEYYKWSETSYIKAELTPEELRIAEIEGNTIIVNELPKVKVDSGVLFIKFKGSYYVWKLGNHITMETKPEAKVPGVKYIYVEEDKKYYIWNNVFRFEDFWRDEEKNPNGGSRMGDYEDNAENRALKFQVEKWDYFEMDKVAAYYIYLMRFGGVDQTVKNAMITTEGPEKIDEETGSTLPSRWFFINYDNDTILGVKNDGHLVFDPYITRETKDGKDAYVYAGRDSTLWNNMEADSDFNKEVTRVDGKLANGTESGKNLNYENAINYYMTTQTSKWCERIYNEDSEKKYISKYVTGWVDNKGKEHLDNYLYDVQGSRDAHRKWWLSRRYNIFDSKFANSSFKSHSIRLKTNNLPAGSKLSIVSGEPVYYAWGHNGAIVQQTPNVINTGERFDFVTTSYINIGSPFYFYGAHNIDTLDIRSAMANLVEIDMNGASSDEFGSKMTNLIIGDHNHPEKTSNITTAFVFDGLGALKTLKVLDITGMRALISLSGLDELKNIEKVYATNSGVGTFSFSEGCKLKEVYLPDTLVGLSLPKIANIKFENIHFQTQNFKKFKNIKIDNCPNLMEDYETVLGWLGGKTDDDLAETTVILHGINWTVTNTGDLKKIYQLGKVGHINDASFDVSGRIHIKDSLPMSDVRKLIDLFGENCFNDPRAKVYITTDDPSLYVIGDENIIEGDGVHTYKFIKISIDDGNKGTFDVSLVDATDNPILDDSYPEIKFKKYNDFCTLQVDENNIENVNDLRIELNYAHGVLTSFANININVIERKYPTSAEITSAFEETLHNMSDMGDYRYMVKFKPEKPTDGTAGDIEYEWSMTGDAAEAMNGEKKFITMMTKPSDSVCTLRLNKTYDGEMDLKVVIRRRYDKKVLFTLTNHIYLMDPNTLFTENRHKEIYDILVKHGFKSEVPGKYTKTDVLKIKDGDLVKTFLDDKGTQVTRSIFAYRDDIIDFTDFKYFGIVNIPDMAFENCDKMETISFRQVTKIGNRAFAGCSSLKSVYGQSNEVVNVVNIDKEAFDGCLSLKDFKHSATLESIGESAFRNCSSITNFGINDVLRNIQIENGNPFYGCENIRFVGGNDLYFIDSENLYMNGAYVNGVFDKKYTSLVYLSGKKDIGSIISDRDIYCCNLSLDGLKQDYVDLPSNVKFNGTYIFKDSVGSTIKLNSKIKDSLNTDYLFSKTQYSNYIFSEGETVLPNYCFLETKNSPTYEIPDTIEEIGNGCFRDNYSIETLIVPASVKVFNETSLWNTSSLKTIYMNPSTPPTMSNSFDLWGVTLDSVYVHGDVYENYINKGIKDSMLILPYIKMADLPKNGMIKIIKDCEFYDPERVIIGTDIIAKKISKGIYSYETNGKDILNRDLSIEENGVVSKVGEISNTLYTLYIGDNLNLYDGRNKNSIDFSKMIFDSSYITNSNGWYYNSTIGGLRSNKIGNREETEITIKVPENIGNKISITYSAYYDSGEKVEVLTENNEKILDFSGEINEGFFKKIVIDNKYKTIKIRYQKNEYSSSGIDGIIIHNIGTPAYSDPFTDGTSNIIINVNGVSDNTNDVILTITDNKTLSYSKMIKTEAENVSVNLPNGKEFFVKSDSFINSNFKYFEPAINSLDAKFVVNDPKEINIDYPIFLGSKYIGENKEAILYGMSDRDYIVYNNKFYARKWGSSGNSIPDVETENVTLSHKKGFDNSYIIFESGNKGLFEYVCNYKGFGDKFKSYVPTYNEIKIIKDNIPELDMTNIWTSEAKDMNNAWTSENVSVNKETPMEFYIFARRIHL